MILEHSEPPPPPKPVETPTKDKTTETETKSTKPTPDAKTKSAPQKSDVEVTAAARKKASGVGLFADNGSDTLAELRSAPAAVQMNQNIKPGSGVGAGSGPGVGAGTDPGLPTRNMITSNATGGSGGINTAGFSRDTGGGGLAGRATTVVEGVAGGYGSGGKGVGAAGNKGGTTQAGKSGKAGRSLEDIRLVFERNKGKIYGIYNRALREDPSLAGKVVVELKIAPSGAVESARLISSELHAPDTEAKLLAMIRQLDFGAKDVDVMTVSYPLDFLPS
jgi:outer membrane biosynthesis protein TonB